MANRSVIDITELDFDARKESLIRFMKTQEEFKDYNYEGASMNVLIDILTANSTMYATYLSFIGNESFHDSAILRSSVVSRSNEKGYVSRSARASKLSVGVKLIGVTGNPSAVNISKNIGIKGNINGESFTFTTIANQALYVTDVLTGTYEGIIDAYEGTLITNRFDVTSTSRYILPNIDVDTSTIKITIQESSTDTTISEYTYSENVMKLTATSKVFFLQEVDGGNFEVTFGDGIIGYAPKVGNIIFVEYLVCHPGKGDGVVSVTFVDNLFPAQTVIMTLIDSSSGSSMRESIDSIKRNSKANYFAQDRAVVPDDYKVIVSKMVPDVIDVNAWGGEDNVPAMYGKTLISVVTNSFNTLPILKKQSIENMIRQKNVTGIRPVVVDAEISRIRLSGRIRVDRELMNIPDSDLVIAVKGVVKKFSTDNLQLFRKGFTYSLMTTQIDKTHSAIKGSLFDVFLVNKIYPDRTKASSYSISFNNVIEQGTVTCSPFYIPFSRPDTLYYIEDINGILKVYGITNGDITTKLYEAGFFGTVNYTTGVVVISQIQTTPAIHPVEWIVEAKVTDKDIDAKYNQVLFIDDTISTINVITYNK
jgi:hypothetical protein